MTSRRKSRVIAAIAVSMLSLSLGSMKSQASSPTEKEALVVAEELKVMISVGTGIIGGLQPEINKGNPDQSKVEKSHLLQKFLINYE